MFRELLILLAGQHLCLLCFLRAAETCLEHYEAIALITPAHYALVLRILQHSAMDIVSTPLHHFSPASPRALVELANLHDIVSAGSNGMLSRRQVTYKVARVVRRSARRTVHGRCSSWARAPVCLMAIIALSSPCVPSHANGCVQLYARPGAMSCVANPSERRGLSARETAGRSDVRVAWLFVEECSARCGGANAQRYGCGRHRYRADRMVARSSSR